MDMSDITAKAAKVSISLLIVLLIAVLSRIFYMQKLHPLSKFPGPWYASSFSVVIATISVLRKEPDYLTYLVRKYGTDSPIRISPTILFFPRPSALKDIYRDPQCNTKSGSYGSGAIGPPQIFSTLDGDQHRALRKALSNAPWTIGPFRKEWESRFDDQVTLLIEKLYEHAAAGRTICLSDKVAEFAADILGLIAFSRPFGSVANQRDEKDLLSNWRKGLTFLGFATRFRFFREKILELPVLGPWLLPAASNDSGMGWLMCEADRQVSAREKQNTEKPFDGKPDFLQYCLDARYSDGSPLSPAQKRAHVTFLIQAGADTTATSMGSILRFMTMHPSALSRAYAEIEKADVSGLLSTPILYEETRQHLPYFIACIKEGLRLNPPGTNVQPRVVPQGGKAIDGHFIPAGTEATSYAFMVNRNREFYGDDAEEFNPERWMQSEKRNFELEAASFTFGTGPRVCMGKDVAMLEMYKLLPEIVRRFDIEMVQSGKYVIDGGVAYNVGFMAKLHARNEKA